MTKLQLDGSPFIIRDAMRDLCRAFMESILNYQSQRRSFYLSRVDTARTEVLPRRAAVQVSSLGSLDVNTGELEIRQPIVDILTEYETWSDYRTSDS